MLHVDVVVMDVVMVVYQKNLQVKVQKSAPVKVPENEVLVAPLALLVQMNTKFLIMRQLLLTVKAKKKKGYTPLENELAAGLAKYFESRTEIEYSVLVDKMKDLPEGQILDLLGIKGKAKEEDSKPTIEEKDEGLTPEDEKEADEFMVELKEQAKEKLEKEKTEREKKERKEKEKASQ